jgi:hypothetical protein
VDAAEWQWADLVILSAMVVQKRDLAHQIGLAKQHGRRVAVGGPFATSTPDAAELAVAALRQYLRERKYRMPKLMEYARLCRVERVMTPYIEAIL